MFVADTVRSFLWGTQESHTRRQVRDVDSGVASLARKFFVLATAVSGCAFVAYPNPATALIFAGALTVTLLTFIATSKGNRRQNSRENAPSHMFSSPPQALAYRAPTFGSTINSSYSSLNSSFSYSPPQAEAPVLPQRSFAPVPPEQARGTVGDNGTRAQAETGHSTAAPHENFTYVPLDLLATQADPVHEAQLRGSLGNDGVRATEARVTPPLASLPTFSAAPAPTSSSAFISQSQVTIAAVDATVLQSQQRGTLGNDGVRADEQRVSPALHSLPTFSTARAPTSSSSSVSESRATIATASATVQQSQLRGTLGNDGVRADEQRVSPPLHSLPAFSTARAPTSSSSSVSQSRATTATASATVQQSQLRGTVGSNGTRSEESKKRSHDSMSSVSTSAAKASHSTNPQSSHASRQAVAAPIVHSGTTAATSSASSQARGVVGRRALEMKLLQDRLLKK